MNNPLRIVSQTEASVCGHITLDAFIVPASYSSPLLFVYERVGCCRRRKGCNTLVSHKGIFWRRFSFLAIVTGNGIIIIFMFSTVKLIYANFKLQTLSHVFFTTCMSQLSRHPWCVCVRACVRACVCVRERERSAMCVIYYIHILGAIDCTIRYSVY